MLPLLRSRYLLQQTIARPVAAFSTAVDAIKAEGSPADGEKGRKFRFKKMRARRFIVADQRKRNGELETKAAQENLPWRIVGATFLHRYPIICKDDEPWEKDFFAVEEKIRAQKKAWFVEQLKGKDSMIIPEESPTHEEIIATLPFTPAPRKTEADLTNDRRSLERRLDDSLFLIVKRNRKDNSWQFPQGKWVEGETMRDTAERVLYRAVGKNRFWFPGNCPMGHFCYEYPEELKKQRKNFGAKLFFHRAVLLPNTRLKIETRLYTDYAWIARDEIPEYFDPETAKYLSYLLPY